ncbi:Mannose-1-phosphate guanylyltransferase RfbM [Paenibacillus sp. CECT 9249]|nr:Mannose-1-phosphate guanylyltransferase RfbM [Paenibacillus sp. CECT 9249]
MLRLILLSGGSGKRLWPLSNDSRSKQFLKVLLNEHGHYESMIQRVWRQIGRSGLEEASVIATSQSQQDIVLGQLNGRAKIIVEPQRKDTFPAIALSALYLYSQEKLHPDEVIAVMPVDPYVELHFFDLIKRTERALKHSGADLALIGVKPTYPAEIYGYIMPRYEDMNEYLKVSYFKEKPGARTAEQLIQGRALWNCGVFSFRLRFLLSILERKGLPVEYERFRQAYPGLPANSFDYEVVEHTDKMIVLPYDGYWKDLGTWETLTNEMANTVVGKGIIKDSGNFPNNHIVNELDIPIAVIGLSDTIVAASPDGILVSSKSASAQIKELAFFVDNRPMYEEKRWGFSKIIDYKKYDNGKEVSIERVQICAGNRIEYPVSQTRKVWTVISGEGEANVAGHRRTVLPGKTLQIERGSAHSILAATDLDMIVVQLNID